jgi:hypothetical protein
MAGKQDGERAVAPAATTYGQHVAASSLVQSDSAIEKP